MTERRCRRCGCRLASDHQDDEWCTPCLASRRDYDPKRDPFFLDEVLHYLILFSPQRVELYKVMGLQPEHRQLLKNAVIKLRRRGFDIRAEARMRGYRYMGVVEISHQEPRSGTVCSITSYGAREVVGRVEDGPKCQSLARPDRHVRWRDDEPVADRADPWGDAAGYFEPAEEA